MNDKRPDRLQQLVRLVIEEIKKRWHQKYLRKQLAVDVISTLALTLADDDKPLELLEEATWTTAHKVKNYIDKAFENREKGGDKKCTRRR